MFNIDRGWRQHLGMKCATVPEYTIRVIWLALMLARRIGNVHEAKVMKMAMVHDLPETRTSDLSYDQKVYVKENEEQAAQDIFESTSLTDYFDVLKEYMARESIESQIVKDADNLDIDIELKELDERGSKAPVKWVNNRRLVREEKLYTQVAKDFWDDLQGADPADWHLHSNKWRQIPGAGK